MPRASVLLSFAPGVTEPSTHFNEVYAEFRPAVEGRVRHQVRERDLHLVEDLAAEVFVQYWRKIQAGQSVCNAGGMLKHLAWQTVAERYRKLKHTQEVTLDLADPAYGAITARLLVTDLDGAPQTAGLAAELRDAMDLMREASLGWRSQHARMARAQASLKGLRARTYRPMAVTPEAERARAAKMKAHERAEVEALRVFRQSCQRVAALRTELQDVERNAAIPR